MLKNFFFFVTDEEANNARALVLGKAFQPILILRVRQGGGGEAPRLGYGLSCKYLFVRQSFPGMVLCFIFPLVIHEESE